MSQMSKMVLWVAFAVIVVGGIWWYASQGGAPGYQSGPAGEYGNNGAASGVSAQGPSDASLNQGLSSIDSQMSGFNSDSANIDKGLNDQPIPQN